MTLAGRSLPGVLRQSSFTGQNQTHRKANAATGEGHVSVNGDV